VAGPATGGLARAASEALLHAAAKRAAGHLETLNVSDCSLITYNALLAVVTANSASLRELHTCGNGDLCFGWPAAEAEALLHAAPGLRACHAAVVTFEPAEARALLRNDPPFGALRLERLSVRGHQFDTENPVLALAADLATCSFISELLVSRTCFETPAALDALVDAVLTCRLRTLRLYGCYFPAASAPALARLLGGGALTELDIDNFGGEPLLVLPRQCLSTRCAHAARSPR
jgi:hypothetical protein